MRRTASFRLGMLLTFGLFSVFSFDGFAQVGIGTTTPNANALLDVDASTIAGGFLLPRLALTATNSSLPLSNPVAAGMVIYNIATDGTTPNNVTPGYYYNDGLKWVRIAKEANKYAVSGDDDTAQSNNNWEDMNDLTITFTPVNSTVYVSYNIFGDFTLVGECRFRLVTGLNTIIPKTEIRYNGKYYQIASPSFPVSVIAGAPTIIKVQWRSGGGTIRNSAGTQDNHGRYLTIID